MDEYFDIESKQYLSELAQHINEMDRDAAEVLGIEHGIPLNTLVIYEILRPDSIGQSEVDISGIITLSALSGMGIFRSTENQALSLQETPRVDGNHAYASILVPTGNGNTFVQTTYSFKKENENWKLNFPSTLSMREKVMSQNRTRRGMTNVDFAIHYANSTDMREMEFSYRANY